MSELNISSSLNSLVQFTKPNSDVWNWPTKNLPLPPTPFSNEEVTRFYNNALNPKVPITIALVYFTSVHLINKIVLNRQIKQAKSKDSKFDASKLTKKQLKRLPPSPYKLATTNLFKKFVLLHNVALCVYSAWTFVGMITTIHINSFDLISNLNVDKFDSLWSSICDIDHGIFSKTIPKNLNFFGFWFYISKFYEVLDTIIILLKGRPSSLLQSYHHAGAMMCMWAGIRYHSPPIWIFVVFNSFIHTLMYFYYSLACLKVRVPSIFKRTLTSMQITQFVVGGSLAVLHLFVTYKDHITGDLKYCIADANQALPLFINVVYLTPLTALFSAFYIESYIRGSKK